MNKKCWLVMLVLGVVLTGCPVPLVNIPDKPEETEETIPDKPEETEETIPDKPEEAEAECHVQENPGTPAVLAEYEVRGVFFNEEGVQIGEPEAISLMGFIPSENGPVQLDFISTGQLEFINIQVEYRLVNGDYDYLNILSEYWGRGVGGLGKGKVNHTETETPFWYDEKMEDMKEWLAHVLVPFSEEFLRARVSVSFRYLVEPEQLQSFVCTILNPNDLDQDYLPDDWEAGYPCFVEQEEGNTALYGQNGYADGDALSNYDEMLHGTDPCLADSDGDGFDDDEEIWGGWRTNPLDGGDHPPYPSTEPGKG